MSEATENQAVEAVPAPEDSESFGDYLSRALEAKKAPAPAPANATESQEEDTEGETGENPEPAHSEEVTVDSLRALAKAGELEKALKLLGVEVDGTKIPSSRFAKFRKVQAKAKAEIAAERARVESQKREIDERVSKVQSEYAGFAKAKQAFDEGDIVGAIEAAFGEQLDVITDKAVKQKLATDPELVKLKRKLEAKEKAEQEAQRKAQEEAQRSAAAAQRAQHIGLVRDALKESSDELLGKLAGHKNFAEQVYSTMLSAYERDGVELEPDEAAQRVLKVLRSEFLEWQPFLATSGATTTETTARAGTEPSITSRAGRAPEKQGRKGVPLSRANASPPKPAAELSDKEEWELLKGRALRAQG